MTSAVEIEELVRQFESGELPRSEWTHEAHVLVGLWYVFQLGEDAARNTMRNSIQRYNARHGNATGYHETITCAWITLISSLVRSYPPDVPLTTLLTSLLKICQEKQILLRHYRQETLFSPEARARWLAPDLAPILSQFVPTLYCGDQGLEKTNPSR